MMNEHGQSDSSIVPGKLPNKAAEAAEAMEGRELAKGNLIQRNTRRTQSREGVHNGLERVREAVRKDKKKRLTALMHHVYDVERLREAYHGVKHGAAPGIDGESWKAFGENLEENLRDLSDRLRRGAYRARPVKRVYIPKADGGKRPIGIPALEDKIVQRAAVQVLNCIWEQEFLGFSYGFRPGRSPHDALDALYVGIRRRKVSWVLDADLRSFFDNLRHEWLVKFVEHRVADRRIVRLIQKWLKAGVLEDGKRIHSDLGTVQGGGISPLLANIYLHYAFDLWVQKWRTTQAAGEVIVVRFADDFVLGFQYRQEAERFLADLRKRMAHLGLELHAGKTRLIEFGRFAAENRKRRGEGKPETFDFLGFTHICWKTGQGKFTIMRKTIRKRLHAKLREVTIELRRRMHDPIPSVGAYLRSVVAGHLRFFGVPMNGPSIGLFHMEVCRRWLKVLRRRSHKHNLTWNRMKRLVTKWIPPARICHPHPWNRFGAIT